MALLSTVFWFVFVSLLNIFYQILDLRISVRVNPQHMRQSSFNQCRTKVVVVQDGLASRHPGLLFPLLSFFTFFSFFNEGWDGKGGGEGGDMCMPMANSC